MSQPNNTKVALLNIQPADMMEEEKEKKAQQAAHEPRQHEKSQSINYDCCTHPKYDRSFAWDAEKHSSYFSSSFSLSRFK